MVADLCFKGNPSKNGEIEIGYGTYENHQGNGYMKEAVERIIKWAFDNKNVKTVIAQTNPENIASQKIVIGNNFIKIEESLENIVWKISK